MTKDELLLEIVRYKRTDYSGSIKSRLKGFWHLYRILVWQRILGIAVL